MGKDTAECESILARLREGNAGFAKKRIVSGKEGNGESAWKMNPFAVVVSCSDLDMTPEEVFGCMPGDLYTVRVAGNLVDGVVLGSVVLAVRRYACPVIVVLGHDRCETIHTAMSPDDTLIREPASVIKLMERLREDIGGPTGAQPDQFVNERSNTCAGVERIVDDSYIADRISEGLLRVVPVLYRHETEKVEWL